MKQSNAKSKPRISTMTTIGKIGITYACNPIYLSWYSILSIKHNNFRKGLNETMRMNAVKVNINIKSNHNN